MLWRLSAVFWQRLCLIISVQVANLLFYSFPIISQFNLKLPAEVDEYYSIRAKCEAAGWQPGQVSLAARSVSCSGWTR